MVAVVVGHEAAPMKWDARMEIPGDGETKEQGHT